MGRPITILLSLIVAAGVLTASAHAAALQTITLQLIWKHQFQFAGYYAAIEKGYYREVGLDVKLVEVQTSMDYVQEVVSGRAQYGVGNSSLILHRDKGRPVVALAAIIQHSPEVLIVREDSGIHTPHDLKGRRVAWRPSGEPLVRAVLSVEGMTTADVVHVPRTFDLHDLIDGKVDAVSIYSSDAKELEDHGIAYHFINPLNYGIDFYGDSLYTTEQEIARHPDRVRAFREASLRGWSYAMSHRQELFKLIREKYAPDMKVADLEYEARCMADLMHPDLVEIGLMNPGRWGRMVDIYTKLGLLKPGFSLNGFLYNPHPQKNDTWLLWAAGVVGVFALMLGGYAWILRSFNRRLQMSVADRTSELRQAKETAESASRAKDDFLSALSHELRTPLTPVMLSISQWDSQTDLPPQWRDELAVVRRNIDLEVRLIDDLLDLTRITRGKLRLELQLTDLRVLLRNANDICSMAEGAPTHLELDDQPCVANVDPARMQQVFWNLLSNARKFTPQNGRVTARCHQSQTGMLQIEVTDTGIGIEPELLSRIFSAFEQGDPGRARQFGGLGLGLAISKAIVVAHQGTLTAASNGHEQGATFTVCIPAAQVDIVPTSHAAGSASSQESRQSLRILLVEDHPSTLQVLKRLLERLGHRVTPARSVSDALAAAAGNTFDLVVSDLGLPDGSGHDLMPVLRDRYALRGIAISGYGMEQDINRSLAAGFAEHLVKPASIATLAQAIERVTE